MMSMAEEAGNTEIAYNEACYGADLEKGIVFLENTINGRRSSVQSDVIFGTDGAFSALRYKAMQKLDQFNYSPAVYRRRL